MKLLKHLFGSKPKLNPKYEPNTLAEINESPDLRLATAKGKESDIPLPAKKPTKKTTKKAAPKTAKSKLSAPVSTPADTSEDTKIVEATAVKSPTKATKTTAKTAVKKPAFAIVTKDNETAPAQNKAPANRKTAPAKTASEAVTAEQNTPTKKVTAVTKKPNSPTKKATKSNASTAASEEKTASNPVEKSENVDASTPAKTRTGRFEIKKSKDGRFVFNLYASNSVIVATSQIYSSSTSAINGIKSVIANAGSAGIEDQTLKNVVTVPYPKWEIYQDKGEQYRFRLCASNGSCVCHSQGYTSKSSCKKGIESIIKTASDAEITKAYLEKKDK